ncbi:MAG: aconitase X swivel domain-containing protein [Candidatus Thorarchaeota archaeon]|jgi:predicted aconitase with swiveling domain
MKLSRILCNPLLSGVASGTALVTSQPICFWGGLDPKTGTITERGHELKGQNVAGTVFVFPTGKGSSTTSAILLESVRCGTAPAAIVNLKTEPMIVIGAIIAEKLYDCVIPIVDEPELNPIKVIKSGAWVEVNASETQGWIQFRH